MRKSANSEQEKELHKQYAQQFSSMASTLPNFSVTTFIGLKDLVESQDYASYTRSATSAVKYAGAGLLGGLITNVMLTSWNPGNFLKRSIFFRIPVRLVMMTIPMIGAVYAGQAHFENIDRLHRKYNNRLSRFKYTHDFNHMDPEGTLFKEFLKKTHQ